MDTKMSNQQIDPDQLLKEEEGAKLCGVTRRAFQQWRFDGKGPRYVSISRRCVRYRRQDIIEWIENHLRASTSDQRRERAV